MLTTQSGQAGGVEEDALLAVATLVEGKLSSENPRTWKF